MKDGLHLKPERVDLFLHDLPEEIPIHFPIVMDEDMAHPSNSLPRNYRVSFFTSALSFQDVSPTISICFKKNQRLTSSRSYSSRDATSWARISLIASMMS